MFHIGVGSLSTHVESLHTNAEILHTDVETSHTNVASLSTDVETFHINVGKADFTAEYVASNAAYTVEEDSPTVKFGCKSFVGKPAFLERF